MYVVTPCDLSFFVAPAFSVPRIYRLGVAMFRTARAPVGAKRMKRQKGLAGTCSLCYGSPD